MRGRPLALAAAAAFGVCGAPDDLWQDQTEEFLDRCVPLGEGGFPAELHGSSLYYAGPSLWSLPGGQRVRHGFDGLGRLHRFYHVAEAGGELLCHSARFIGSPGTKAILGECDLTSAGAFRRVEGAAWWTRLPLANLLVANLDNTWVNSMSFGPGRLELMTDSSEVLEADPQTLEATKVRWADSLVKSWLPVPPLSTAHPVVHPVTGQAYNIMVDPGVFDNEVVLFRRDPGAPTKRVEVARIGVGPRVTQHHSWALSLDFAMVLGSPMFGPMFGVSALAATDGLLDTLVEMPSVQNFTRIFVVPLNATSPSDVQEIAAPPFVNVHVVNAYREEDETIVLDFEGRPTAAEDTESFFDAFRTELVQSRNRELVRSYIQDHFADRGYGLYRLEIPPPRRAQREPSKSEAGRPPTLRPLHPAASLAFPQLSPLVRGRRHCFVWAPGIMAVMEEPATIVKLSLCGSGGPRMERAWALGNYSLAAEASFVPSHAEGAGEDAGWLLAPLQEAQEGGGGALAVVDAASMELVSLTLLAEGDLLNWGAHSTFLSAAEVAAAATDRVREQTTLTEVRDALKRCARRTSGSDL